MSTTLTLDQVPSGKKVKVVSIYAPGRWGHRLLQMGLVPGAVLEVVVNDGYGPILIRVMNTKVLLGRGIARRVLVQPIEQ